VRILNETKNPRHHDLDRLSGLKSLAWLSPSELARLANALASRSFKRRELVFSETDLASTDVHILLSGIARITCLNARGRRVTVALLPPGPIPEFPSLPISRSKFQCEAYNDCRVGSLTQTAFEGVRTESAPSASEFLRQNNLRLWYRLLLRSSSFLNLGLRERIAITLLELCSDFGIEESRGTLLLESFSQKDISNLVGASRPRVTEYLTQLEREKLVVRQGRRFVVCVAKLANSIDAPAVQQSRGGAADRTSTS
jgi:CRP/FNR family transcriptional regulator, cyclic AMP receptor protein